MRDLRAADCLRILSSFGFEERGATPIRILLTRGVRRVLVPRHGPISDIELAGILAAAGVTADAFLEREYALEEVPSRRSGIPISLPRAG
jgi:hypothetical protein